MHGRDSRSINSQERREYSLDKNKNMSGLLASIEEMIPNPNLKMENIFYEPVQRLIPEGNQVQEDQTLILPSRDAFRFDGGQRDVKRTETSIISALSSQHQQDTEQKTKYKAFLMDTGTARSSRGPRSPDRNFSRSPLRGTGYSRNLEEIESTPSILVKLGRVTSNSTQTLTNPRLLKEKKQVDCVRSCIT
eukprot:TRINITY_DN4388_c0_g1_i6.p1 TRINITY_DN4388_c0_g1~~TRINITY_DN4388_c0_g1_i6.p1  ORF type:complete len:191 (+),score=11.60 TRINITY_DN4388_c0_g1_i6:101-673(+)